VVLVGIVIHRYQVIFFLRLPVITTVTALQGFRWDSGTDVVQRIVNGGQSTKEKSGEHLS